MVQSQVEVFRCGLFNFPPSGRERADVQDASDEEDSEVVEGGGGNKENEIFSTKIAYSAGFLRTSRLH